MNWKNLNFWSNYSYEVLEDTWTLLIPVLYLYSDFDSDMILDSDTFEKKFTKFTKKTRSRDDCIIDCKQNA